MLRTYIHQLREVMHREGTASPFVALAIMASTLKYGTSPNNYVDFGFSKMNARQRATYLTYRHNRRLIAKAGDPLAISRLQDKFEFSLHFAPYLGRKVMSLEHAMAAGVDEFLNQAGGGTIEAQI